MNVKKTTAYFNNHTHKNHRKSWSAFKTLIEHLLQLNNEKNENRFNRSLANLSSFTYGESEYKTIDKLSEREKESLVEEILKHFKDQVNKYENKTDKLTDEEYKKQSKRAAAYKQKIKATLNKSENIKKLDQEILDQIVHLVNKIDSEPYTYGSYGSVDPEDQASRKEYKFPPESDHIPEEIRKNLVLFSQAKVEMEKIHGAKKKYLRSGQGFALDTVFRIPLQNKDNFDEEFYKTATVDFFKTYLPDFKTKLVVIHQNEYFMSDDEIQNLKLNGKTDLQIQEIITENAKMTAHCQTVLDLFNEKDQEYNFQEKKFEAINKYIKDHKIDINPIPPKGKLNAKQTKSVGVIFQKMFYEFVNSKQEKLKLVKVEELDQEDLTEERKLYINRKTIYGNVRLKNRDFFSKTDQSIKDSIYSAAGKLEEDKIIFSKENKKILEMRLEAEIKPSIEEKVKLKLRAEITPLITKELTENIKSEITPIIKEDLKEQITKEEKPKMKLEIITKIREEIELKVPAARQKLIEKKKLQLEAEVQEELILSKDKLITEENKKILLEYRQKNQDKIIKDIKKDIEAEERVKLANRDFNKYYILKAEFQTKLSLYPMIEDKYKKKLRDEFDNLIDRIRDAFKAAFNFFSQLEQGKEQRYTDNLESELNYTLNHLNSANNTNKIQSPENKPKIKL